MNYVEIAVDVPLGPSRTFTYKVPENMQVSLGHMVRVPFSNRTVTGIIFSVVTTPLVASVLEILELVSAEVVFTDMQLVLAKWVSEHYYANLYQAAIAMLPSGITPKSTMVFQSSGDLDKSRLDLESLQVLEYIENHGSVAQPDLIREFGRSSRNLMKNLIAKGIVARHESIMPPRVRPKMQQFLSINRTMGDHQEMLLHLTRSPKQKQAFTFLHRAQTPVLAKVVRARFGAQSIRSLISKNYLTVHQIRSYRTPTIGQEPLIDTNRILSHDQERAVTEIQNSLDAHPRSRKILLWGIAGSGKTEVYIRAIDECLTRGRTAIILVPDISLTGQTVGEVVSRFPNQVAVLHSGLSAGEQFDQWQQILEGSFKIVVGVRSAIFAPMDKLGLIVVDEEHDWNYKQSDKAPRYHAREVAAKLADLSGAVLICGSATPDVASYHAAQHNQYELLQMHSRPSGRTNRSVHTTIVDMRTELSSGNRSIFSRQLLDKLTECLAQNSKAIFFINRRGTAQSVQCRNCGYVAACPRCGINLTYHSEANRLICHHCGITRKSPDHCPVCADKRIRFLGLGTQRVVQELGFHVPDTEIIRYDSDVARTLREHEAINKKFREPGSKIMVGTQMLAKGLDFPDVGLVGIVLADLGLSAPNFRASERSFQLLAQVAGRAGRREAEGNVVIQTYVPDHYVLRALEKQQYVEFAMKELAYREQLKQPPFARHVRIICQHYDYEQSRNLANRFVDGLTSIRDSSGFAVDVLGPTSAHPHTLNGKYRWQVVLRGDTPMEILLKVDVPIDAIVDVDPIEVN